MSKIKTSISIDVAAFENIKRMATKFFNGNISKCVEWFGHSKQERLEFMKFMGKHHAQQLYLYQEVIENITEEVKILVKA